MAREQVLDYEIPVYFVDVTELVPRQLCKKEKDFIVIARPIRCSGAIYETDCLKRSVQRQTFHSVMELLIRRYLCYGGVGRVGSEQFSRPFCKKPAHTSRCEPDTELYLKN